MWTKIGDFFIILALQTLNYGLLVLNYRSVAKADYFWSATTDFMIASFSFFVIKKIAKSDDSVHLWLGYALGGVLGSIVGIQMSLFILKS